MEVFSPLTLSHPLQNTYLVYPCQILPWISLRNWEMEAGKSLLGLAIEKNFACPTIEIQATENKKVQIKMVE